MSTATKFKLGLLTLLVLILGGKLLGDTVGTWSNGNEKGVINLPACAKQDRTTVASSSSTYRFGYRMTHIQNGCRLVPPSSMTSCVVIASTGGVPVATSGMEGDIIIDGETLMLLRDNDVSSFTLRLVDVEGDFIEVKFALTAGSDNYEVLVR